MTPNDIRAAVRRPLSAAVAGLAVIGVGAMMLAAGPQTSAVAAGETFSEAQKGQIEGIIKAYLLKNPELMVEIQRTLEQKQEVARQETMTKAVSSNAASLYRSSTAPVAGDVNGDVTVVEFFDYNCGYCRKAVGDVTKLIASDKKVRVVLKEFPIFGKRSEDVARLALAAKIQGKYWEMHQALFERKGKDHADPAIAIELAKGLGLDVDKLQKDATSDEVTKEILRVRQLADKMGIQGTPHFIIGEKVIPGAPEDLFDEMASLVGEVRKNGCKIC